ncbi:MAG: hypothetical protein SWK76_10085 [Actinomycetota bacterium]|nr:hypothetical protein [Actinomycetota bacterium]
MEEIRKGNVRVGYGGNRNGYKNRMKEGTKTIEGEKERRIQYLKETNKEMKKSLKAIMLEEALRIERKRAVVIYEKEMEKTLETERSEEIAIIKGLRHKKP